MGRFVPATQFLLATIVLMFTSRSIACGYVAVVLTFSFLVPYALCSMQRFKNTINGPWDEARVREIAAADD